MNKAIEFTNGKKTTAVAVAYLILQLVRIKNPNFLHGHDEIVANAFTILFSSTLVHKFIRQVNIKEIWNKIFSKTKKA